MPAVTVKVADYSPLVVSYDIEQPTSSDVLVVGGRIKNTTWTDGEAFIGPVRATRYFESDNISPTQSRSYSGTAGKITIPDDVTMWVSFTDATTDANLKSYLASMDPRTRMVLCHEPEDNKFSSGAAYVSWFTQTAGVIHSSAPGTKCVHAAAAYQYRPSGSGYDGSYIPPASACDVYTIDTYRGKTDVSDMVPLEQDDRFQRWLSLLPAGVDIGITEYGRGQATPTDPSDPRNQKRIQNLPLDDAYLKSNPQGHRVVTWQYWWTENSGGDWQFNDDGSGVAWRQIAQEHSAATD